MIRLTPVWASGNPKKSTAAIARMKSQRRLYRVIASDRAYPDAEILAARKITDEQLASRFVLGLLLPFMDDNTAQIVAALAANMKNQDSLYKWYVHLTATDSYSNSLKVAIRGVTNSIDEQYIVDKLCQEYVFDQSFLLERVHTSACLYQLAQNGKQMEDRIAAAVKFMELYGPSPESIGLIVEMVSIYPCQKQSILALINYEASLQIIINSLDALQSDK